MAQDKHAQASTQGRERASAEQQARAKQAQGHYGSGGSYGVGGGFEDDEQRDSAPDSAAGDPEDRAARVAAQQDDSQMSGFEREVDPDAAPPRAPREARTRDEQALAEKNQRGSRQ